MKHPRRTAVALAATGTAAVLLVAAVLTGAAGRAGASVLYGTGLWVDGGASTVPPSLFSPSPTPTPTPPPPGGDPRPVLGPASPGKPVDAKALARRIAEVSRTDVGTVGAVVLDAETGKAVYAARPNSPMIPASTMKLLTSVSVLDALGPGHRFTTSVVSPSPGALVLVGGGDPYLRSAHDPAVPGRADLATLAKRTADSLKSAGTTSVTLNYDASLFAGPKWNPKWPERYGDEVAPTAALWVDGARTNDTNPGPRDADPPKAAAAVFRAALEKQGIKVTAVTPGTAPKDASPVAKVESEPLATIVESVLNHSDNDAAEVLFRHVSVAAGGDGSIGHSTKAVRQHLTELGVWVDGTKLVDGSGMARQNKVPATVIAGIIGLGLSADHPELRGLLTGLPVAGATGSLAYRFFSPGTELGRGAVRAKTGTLTKVHSLGGYTRTQSGRVLVFAFLVNGGDPFPDRVYLDRVTSAITACGC